MRPRTWKRGAVALLVGTGALLATGASPVTAQDATGREEASCRCVDADGRTIEGCHCFRGVPLEAARSFTFTATPAPRARIGVMVGGEDDAADRGVVLRDVDEGSPADDAGLRPGDLVVGVGGRSVLEPLGDEDEPAPGAPATAVSRFVALVGSLEPGEEVEIEYLRDGETRRATVVPEAAGPFYGMIRSGLARGLPGEITLRSMPEARIFLRADSLLGGGDRESVHFFDGRGEGGRAWSLGEEGEGLSVLARSFDPCFGGFGDDAAVIVASERCVDGLRLQAMNDGLAEYFHTERGVLVTEVAEESTLGLRPGDVVVAIGDRTVEGPGDVRRILGSYELDEPVLLRVVRRGEEIQVRGTRR